MSGVSVESTNIEIGGGSHVGTLRCNPSLQINPIKLDGSNYLA